MVLELRPATWEDRELLLSWRNDPETRQNSLNSDPVQPGEHERWLRRSLELHPERQLWIAELEAVPVGTARLDRGPQGWELSWTVAPPARGRGVGKALVAQALRLVTGQVNAVIKAGNQASLAIARHCGLILQREEGGLSYWALPEKEEGPA